MEQLVNIKYIFFYPQNYEFRFVQKVMALETSCFYKWRRQVDPHFKFCLQTLKRLLKLPVNEYWI